jgi:hypothetical protein
MRKLAIIFPEFKLQNNSYIHQILSYYAKYSENIEFVIVTREGNLNFENLSWVKVIYHPTEKRGERLKIGLECSSAPMILFHHPRSIIENAGIEYLIKNYEKLQWGGFTHQFDHKHRLAYKFTSWYSNKIRGDIKGIYYLDHCIYGHRKILQKIEQFPQMEIFEDTELSKQLLRIQKPKRLPFYSKTSSIRFQTNGWMKQSLMNQKLKWDYWRNKNYSDMNRVYEKNTGLNTEYDQ